MCLICRWKRQATLNAAAVIEAKNEVLERKRELDSTKDKLDHLVEKLYAGREANVSLSGAIAAAANYQQVSVSDNWPTRPSPLMKVPRGFGWW